MRWIVRLLVVCAVAWAVYAVSPYYALYDLMRAVEARDAQAIKSRVNFSALRISLARQLAGAYVAASGQRELGTSSRGLAAAAAATVLDPLLARYVSPEGLAELMSGRAPGLPGRDQGAIATVGLESGFASFRAAWRLFVATESRGFRVVSFPLPPDQDPDNQFRIVFRLGNFAWRVVGVELPKSLQDRLVQDLIRREGKPSTG